MTEKIIMPPQILSDEQAADTILSYYRGENWKELENGWKPKVPLGISALHASSRTHSILPNNEPLLTPEERALGLAHLSGFADQEVASTPDAPEKPDSPVSSESPWPVEPTVEQWKEIEKLSSSSSLDIAYQRVMRVRPTHWK